MTANITVRAWKVRKGSAPGTRIRCGLVRDVGWNVARLVTTAPKPHADARVTELDGVGSATLLVEGLAECGFAGRLHPASGVVVGSVVAVARENLAGFLALDVHLAVVGCVERHLVAGGGLVDAFHDIDFAWAFGQLFVSEGISR